MKVYIAGKVTGNPNYVDEFFFASAFYKALGHIVLNPATLPDGMNTADYMRICLPMLFTADCVVLLPSWKESKGAKIEKELAAYIGIGTIFAENDPGFMRLWSNAHEP